jgi:hypothetical protein
MFNFVQWDSPLMLVAELALSVAFIAGVLFVARIVNSRSARPPHNQGGDAGELPLKDE